MSSHTSNSELPSKAMGEEKSPVEVKIEVYKSIMAKESERVVEICRKHHEWVLGEVIAASGDTVLHKIVSDGKEDIVKQLMGIIKPEDLEKANIIGNNLLHMAASAGSAKMCESFITINPELLMNSRNKDGETPLFLAVLYGRKEAFLRLRELSSCSSTDQDCLCLSRKNNGDTILHCAIAGDYFELALLIIERHKELVSYVNEKGINPLHLLATRRTAFRSGSEHGIWSGIIYNHIRIDKPWEATTSEPQGLFWRLKNAIYSTVCAAYGGNSQGRRQEHATNVEDPPERNASLKVWITEIKKEKEKYAFAAKVLEELCKISATHEYYATGGQPMKLEESWAAHACYKTRGQHMSSDSKEEMVDYAYESSERGLEETSNAPPKISDKKNVRSPILVAAQNGIKEVVEATIEHIPMAVNDMDSEGKNVVLLAVENRQFNVYRLLLNKFTKHDSIFHKIDHEGNTALLLAAMQAKYKAELSPNSFLIMRREIKWFKYVKKLTPPYLLSNLNKEGKTAEEVFADEHTNLIKEASEEVKKMANSGSIVAALVATVAFATSPTIPSESNQRPGHHPAFFIFALASPVALFCSLAALLTFLLIMVTPHNWRDFGTKLALKFMVGFEFLVLSLVSMSVSYCSSYSFLIKDVQKKEFKDPGSVYTLCFLVCLYAIWCFFKVWSFFGSSF